MLTGSTSFSNQNYLVLNMDHPSCTIELFHTTYLLNGLKQPYYYILIMNEGAAFSVDFTEYMCKGNTLLFLSPYQFFKLRHYPYTEMSALRFHGDFYCIEYHKKEVACNGVLFNNIYQQPFVSVNEQTFQEISACVQKMRRFGDMETEYDTSILKSYLQLILALSSKEKQQQINLANIATSHLINITAFQTVLESYFLKTKEIAFYADQFGLSVNAFSKKIKRHLGKSPSKLIQERIALEAKKLLHLTNKPIKEIAADLNFQDEYYFSRYFKKEVGVSPKNFRDQVGISIVAKLSI